MRRLLAILLGRSTSGAYVMKRTALRCEFLSCVLLVVAGCSASSRVDKPYNAPDLRIRAMAALETAVRYPHNPVVRVAAVEALEHGAGLRGLSAIRGALMDGHPAVRFAACIAIGQLGDAVSTGALRGLLDDEDQSVQVAALFALHRLGNSGLTGRIPSYLLGSKDVAVRRNAAMVLGLMGEPGAIKILARAMRDSEPGVRQHALEAMARLGNSEARQELTFMANAGVGTDEVFALTALSGTKDPRYLETFRYKFVNAPHLETRLSAAGCMGLLGSDEGFEVALRALALNKPLQPTPKDPPGEQVLRVRQLAAWALGAIARVDALPALSKYLERDDDPRMQVAVAGAILLIVEKDQSRTLPFLRAK